MLVLEIAVEWQSAQGQFSSMEEIFTHTPDKKLGDSMSIGCWIDGSATLRKR